MLLQHRHSGQFVWAVMSQQLERFVVSQAMPLTRLVPGTVSTKIDFSGFDPSPPRSNHEHKQQAQEILNQTSTGDCSDLEQKYGTRYNELMQLPYFDCVRFHVIHPMHKLFVRTAKHITRNIWLDSDKPLPYLLKQVPHWGQKSKKRRTPDALTADI